MKGGGGGGGGGRGDSTNQALDSIQQQIKTCRIAVFALEKIRGNPLKYNHWWSPKVKSRCLVHSPRGHFYLTD